MYNYTTKQKQYYTAVFMDYIDYINDYFNRNVEHDDYEAIEQWILEYEPESLMPYETFKLLTKGRKVRVRSASYHYFKNHQIVEVYGIDKEVILIGELRRQGIPCTQIISLSDIEEVLK